MPKMIITPPVTCLNVHAVVDSCILHEWMLKVVEKICLSRRKDDENETVEFDIGEKPPNQDGCIIN